jgi:hypothetical protein
MASPAAPATAGCRGWRPDALQTPFRGDLVSAIVPPIDTALSVNEILRRYPAAARVLNAFGIDSCCGGAAPLEDAAREAGVQAVDVALAIAALAADAFERGAQ